MSSDNLYRLSGKIKYCEAFFNMFLLYCRAVSNFSYTTFTQLVDERALHPILTHQLWPNNYGLTGRYCGFKCYLDLVLSQTVKYFGV